MNATPIKVLLIEDNPGDAHLVERYLSGDAQSGIELEHADRVGLGLEALRRDPVDLVLLDLNLPDSRGLATFEKVHASFPEIPKIVMTGQESFPPIAVSGAYALRRRAGWLLCALGLLCLGASTLGFARSHVEPGTPLTLKNADVTWGRLLHRKYPNDIARGVAMTSSLPDERREMLLLGIGWGIEDAHEQRGTLTELVESLERLPEAERTLVLTGLEWSLETRRQKLEEALARHEDADLRRTLMRLEALADWVEGASPAR